MARKPVDPLQKLIDRAVNTVAKEMGAILSGLLNGAAPAAPAPAPDLSRFLFADALAVLGLRADATREEVDRRFRRLSTLAHPDKEGGDAEWFKELNHARRVVYAERGWK